jgi:hypothetical protein
LSSFQASPRFAKNAPISRFPLRGPPIPGLGNPEEDGRSIPTVCNLGPLLSSVSCGVVRGGAVDGVMVVVVGRGAAEDTGDARLGDRGAEGDERDRLVEDADDDEDLDVDPDERDDLFLVRRTGRRRASVIAAV